jgi:MYXO-CTERM domain-containing protein
MGSPEPASAIDAATMVPGDVDTMPSVDAAAASARNDAATSAVRDATSPGASEEEDPVSDRTDAGVGAHKGSSGCGCSVPERPGEDARAWLGLLGLGLILGVRRRSVRSVVR